MRNARLDELKAGIKIAGKNINNLRYAEVDNTVIAESEEKLKSLLKKVKESEKAGLKLSIQKTKIMASSLISWQTDGETIETVTDFICLGPKVTVDGHYSHKMKRRLLLGRKAMTNLVKAKVAHSCLTLCDPMNCSPPGSSVHGDSPDKNTRVGSHFLLQGIFPTQG